MDIEDLYSEEQNNVLFRYGFYKTITAILENKIPTLLTTLNGPSKVDEGKILAIAYKKEITGYTLLNPGQSKEDLFNYIQEINNEPGTTR